MPNEVISKSASPFLTIATAMAKRGVAVVPTHRGERRPLLKEWQNLATTDLGIITEWGSNGYADANCCSVAKKDGMGMLDIDDLQAARRRGMPELPVTLIVKTPGGGWHVYFKHTAASRTLGSYFSVVENSKAIVEFKGHNAAVCAPGCTRSSDGGKYEIERDAPIAELPIEWVTWLLAIAPVGKSNSGTKGIKVAEDFYFDDLCDFFNIEIAQIRGIWHSPSVCPIKGDHHTSEGKPDITACAFAWDEDNRTLGWKDHAAGCAGSSMSIGEVIKFLNEKKGEPYRGPIWDSNTDEVTCWELEEIDPELEVPPTTISPEQFKELFKARAVSPATPDDPAFEAAVAELAPPVPLPPPSSIVIAAPPVTGLEFDPRALHGKLGEKARQLESQGIPLGYSYPALLTVASALDIADIDHHVRGNLYTALLGDVAVGKSAVTKAAVAISCRRIPINTLHQAAIVG